MRGHDHREQLHPRRVRRGEEAREHSARDAGGPGTPDPGRAYLRAGLHGGAPPGGDAGVAGEEGEDGGDVGAPAVEPRLPDVRQGAGVVGRLLLVLRQRNRRHAILRVGWVRAILSG